MYIAMLKRVSSVAFISISLASCGGTATDTLSVTEYLNAINDIPATQSDDTTTSTIQTTPSSAQSVTVSWQDPTRNTDNSCLDELEGYTLHYGTSPGSYDQTVDLQVASGDVSCAQTDYDSTCSKSVMTCSYVTEQLPADTWYFAVQTYDTQGSLSGYSNEVIKIIN